MKKIAASLLAAMTLTSMLACSNWNRATPASMDNTAIEAEVRKNLAADSITGLTVTVNDKTRSQQVQDYLAGTAPSGQVSPTSTC